MNIEAYERDILPQYPKTRSVLEPEYQAIYVKHYKTNRDGDSAATGLAQKMERWMHYQVAKDVKNVTAPKTLEIGAGTLNHLQYETIREYDIVEPFTELFEHLPEREQVQSIYDSIHDIEGAEIYNRIVSIATFEHILDLPHVTARAATLLKPDGSLRVAIPAEGSWLWKLGWTMTTGIEFRLAHNLRYATLMEHEHVNNYYEISSTLRYFFNNVKRTQFGIAPHTSFYQFYECKNPNIERARKFLNGHTC